MHPVHVIKRPLITEKATFGNEQSRYSFEVSADASKTDIKSAIESIYKVKVEKVSTQNRKGKLRRLKYGYVHEKTVKTAVVRLRDGDVIELF